MAKRNRRDLTLSEIVDVSRPILSEEGEAGLSMRRVAKACGVTPMALYHHVATKKDLVDVIMDDVVAAVLDPVEQAEDWRTEMLEFCGRLRAVMVDHPGVGEIWVRRPLVTPNMARITERLFEILARGGIVDQAAARATDAIVLVVVGSIAYDLSRPPQVRRELAGHMPEDATPLMTANLNTYAVRDEEARFRDAMRWMLDGVESG